MIQNTWGPTYLFAEDFVNANFGRDQVPSLPLVCPPLTTVPCHTVLPQPPMPPFPCKPSCPPPVEPPPNATGGKSHGDNLVVTTSFS